MKKNSNASHENYALLKKKSGTSEIQNPTQKPNKPSEKGCAPNCTVHVHGKITTIQYKSILKDAIRSWIYEIRDDTVS